MRVATGWVLVSCFCLSLGCEGKLFAAGPKAPTLLESEEAFEVRMERLLKAKGNQAVFDHLAREFAERPRPYVKAWYANYLLYGAEFGLKGVADPEKGFVLAEQARAEGSLFGLELVGRAWGDGRGTGQRDVNKALELLREAAGHDRDSAMSELGKFYFFGIGGPADRVLAEAVMRQAACRGATGGMFMLAGWWEDSRYKPVPDRAKALALYAEVLEFGATGARKLLRDRAKAGEAAAQKYVHLDLVTGAARGGDPLPTQLRAAVKWLEAHATPDDGPVQLALADVMKERRLTVFDAEAAKAKLARAAAAGSDEARAMQAMMTWRGIGQKTDKARAIATWRELADKGNGYALNQMGWLHWWGNAEAQGVEKDAAKAFTLCKRSADRGHWAGQLNLADAYNHGIGTAVNYYLAVKYYEILENRGYLHAREMRNRILALVKD